MTEEKNKWDDRPRYKGLVVPYSIQWFDATIYGVPTKIPDFKVTSFEAVVECVLEGLCGLCGHKNLGRLAFIGGEASMQSHLFTDPPMHRDCALYAYKACPFLNGTITRMAEETREHIHVNSLASTVRPAKYGLYITRSCWLGTFEGERVIMAASGGKVRWL